MYHDKPLDDPLIGLISTRQLLMELKERGIIETYHFDKGAWLAMAAQTILERLPKSMLDFRYIEREAIPAIPPGVEGHPVGSHIHLVTDTYDRNAV